MRPPDFPAHDIPYRELYAAGAFAQRPLVSNSNLRRAADRRGLNLPLFPRQLLESLDRRELFCPVAFRQTNYTAETTWLHPDPDLLLFREELPFRAWDDHGISFYGDDPPTITDCYCEWQLLYLDDVLASLQYSVPAELLESSGGNDAETHWQRLRERFAERRPLIRAQEAQWQPIIKFLVSLQSYFWPLVRESTTLLYENGERVDQHRRALAELDPHAHAARFGITSEDVATLHRVLAMQARALDPLRQWYLLARAAPRKRYESLRGDIARAGDLYDACFLLRAFYLRLTDEFLPDADEVVDTEMVRVRKQKLLGHGPRLRPGLVDLKPILESLGLYPHRLHFFVEGPTERIVLRELLPWLGYDMERGSIQITSFGGVDKAERYRSIFEAASAYAARTVLIADWEGEIESVADRLADAGVLDRETDVILWEKDGRKSSFEEVNFTAAEFIQLVRAAAKKRDPSVKLKLTPKELDDAYASHLERRRSEGREPEGFAKVALRLANTDRHGRVRVSKIELAEQIVARFKREIRATGHIANAGKKRPFLSRLWSYIASARA